MTTPTTAPADELLRAMQDDGIIAAAPPEALPAHRPGRYEYTHVLCYAWGESDFPVAALARTRAEVRKFMADQWFGSNDDPDLDEAMARFDAERDDGDSWDGTDSIVWEFEIGGVRLTKVYEAALAAPAEGQQPAFNRECDDADELLRLLGFEPDDVRTDGGSINLPKVRSLLRERAEVQQPAEPAPAQEGRQAVGPIHRHIKRGTLYTEVGRGKLQTDEPLSDMEDLVAYRGEDGVLWFRPVSEFGDRSRFEPLPTAPASAPSEDLSAAIRALPLPEPVSMVASSADGFFSREQVRALLESAASLVRATPPDLAAELPDPNAKCDLGTLQGALMNNQPLNVNQRSALYAMAAELRECREDAERLNWLERHDRNWIASRAGAEVTLTTGDLRRERCHTLRAAIDAMRAKGGAQ